MKKKFLISLSSIAIVVVILFLVNACSKDDSSISNSGSSKLLSFKNLEEYNSELNRVLNMDLEGLKTYEDSKGYKSFGRLSEELYYNANFENFKSAEDVKAFVSSNSKYLRLVVDDEGELYIKTCLSNSTDRYFINEDKMFRIANNIYKVFENGTVYTNIDNINALKQLNSVESARKNEKYNIIEVTQLSTKACRSSASAYATRDKNRTNIEIELKSGEPFKIDVLIRPYKKTLGIWYWCNRTISYDLKFAVDMYDKSTGKWDRWSYSISHPGRLDSKVDMSISTSVGYNKNVSFAGYDCWAKTPDTDKAYVKCNEGIF